jgi:hypothetical protein
MSSSQLALVIAVLGAGAAGWGVVRYLLPKAKSTVASSLTFATGVLVAVATLWPIIGTLAPGDSIAHGALHKTGDSVDVPQTRGELRVLVHARLGGEGATDIDYTLSGGGDEAFGRLARTVGTSRVGRRGSATVSHERSREFVTLSLAPDHPSIELTHLGGAAPEGLELEVYHPFFMRLPAAALALIALALALGLTLRTGIDSSAFAIAATSVAFGWLVYRDATPAAPISAEIGSFIQAILGGGLGAGLILWLVRRFPLFRAPARS